MPDGIRWVGLDVHARESTFAIFDQDSGEVTTKRVTRRERRRARGTPTRQVAKILKLLREVEQ